MFFTHGVNDHHESVGLMSVASIPYCSLTVLGQARVPVGITPAFRGQGRSTKGTRDKALGLHSHGRWQGLAHSTGLRAAMPPTPVANLPVRDSYYSREISHDQSCGKEGPAANINIWSAARKETPSPGSRRPSALKTDGRLAQMTRSRLRGCEQGRVFVSTTGKLGYSRLRDFEFGL